MNRLVALVSAGAVALSTSGSTWAGSGPELAPAQIAAAKTAADHEAIARAYEQEAADLESKAALHQSMKDAYRFPSRPAGVKQSIHCVAIVKDLQAAAKESRALAAAHRQWAKDAAK